MSSTIFSNILRFLLLVLIQVLFLRRVALEWPSFPYLHILVYPLFIMLLPFRTNRSLQISLAFLLGLTVDLFYFSPGIHASACLVTAYLRPYVLYMLEPRGGYNINYSPSWTRLGFKWFLRYSSILLVIHLFWYFSVEAFTFVYIIDILLNTFFGFLFSMAGIILLMFILNPSD